MLALFKRHYVVLSLALYLGSLFLDAVPVSEVTMRGMHVLTLGWLGGSAWWANPLLCLALMLRRNRPLLSLLAAVAALVLAAQWLPVIGWGDSALVPRKANGQANLLGAYYLWLLALAAYVAGQFLNRRQAPGGPGQGWLAWVLVAAIYATAAFSFSVGSGANVTPPAPAIPSNSI
ncbi:MULTISPECIES: hypothetical protein [Pseudomonas]|jgi:hypothetical protein|uniref:Uncharacterized protein n=1 Tax=Pseudomonas qingdaonensis TaxID=2056231 RepID=A0ABX8DUD5_9PSED|nr:MULTISPECIES: hypothetical protein [Pseudomonas]MBG8560632.1 hypothetical protein [Pseudomonas qingdaonensis]MCQ0166580.1 hypothetical protein [Pseudomonas sp. S12(2018)]OOW04734.1 hypothetical protein MF6396_06480 [Pseudomonas sp. MF6396]OUM25287.1 hypothetical protein B8W70_21355 [Pseudomonas sp. 1239]QVL19833.1 hypothetical protein KH389_04405 [Pseudomonas qingdaonensis]